MLVPALSSVSAEPGQLPTPDPRITPGQVIDGWGMPIPCRCRFQGHAFQLGDIVCMDTHIGTVLTRCELFMNNTSWMPSQQPCTISQIRAANLADASTLKPRPAVMPGSPSGPTAE